MKSIAAALAAITLAVLPNVAQAQSIILEEEQHKNISFLRDDNVTISDPFTPFGNSLEVAKFGDDGSRVMIDLSGVLLWSDKDGEYTRVPNTELAVPLFVTNNELIVWNNRYVDFASYPERPALDLKLYRIDATGAVVATDISVLGKEVLETSEITTSSGSLVITTTERVEGRSTPHNNDTMTIRVYRVTFTGAVQRISTFTDGSIPIDANPWESTQLGPQAQSLGYGSDGSVLYEYPDDDDDVFVWVNSTGISKILSLESGGALTRVLSVSNNRLVLEEDKDGEKTIYDYRRAAGTGPIAANPGEIVVLGDLMSIGNVTIAGNNKYFYTRDEAASTIRTYELTDTGATQKGLAQVDVGDSEVIKINPVDGSAIIRGEGSTKLIWLFSTARPAAPLPFTINEFIEIDSSELASAMFVSNDECLMWTNAKAPIPSGGVPDQAVVEHLVRSGGPDFMETTNTPLITDGIYVIDTPRTVPDFEYWSINTSEKTAPDNALMRAYQLELFGDLDRDSDGLLDTQEVLLGTDPADPDSDDDGLTDGQEVNPYYLVEGSYSWDLAQSDAESRGGHLVTITDNLHAVLSLPEYMRVQSALGAITTRYWIGANDIEIEGTFEWVTDEPFAYTNWAPGEPNNQDNSDGVELRTDFTWNDAKLDEQKGYILEVSATNPLLADTDGDGLSDSAEVYTHFTDPTNPDTDGDSPDDIQLTDGDEVAKGTDPLNDSSPLFTDADGDGLTDYEELYGGYGTSWTNADSDGDGLTDGEEVNTYGTDPAHSDTDGDNMNDYDEINNGTDPNVPSFGGGGGGGGVIIDPTDPAVYGTYTGLVYESDNTPVGVITLKVSKKGSFSGRLNGYAGAKSKMKGKFDPLGHYSGEQYNADGLSSNADMQIGDAGKGYNRIGGTFVTVDNRIQYYNLTRAIYSKSMPTALAANYTVLLPSSVTDSDFVPAGDGIASGSVKSDGKIKLKGYSNAGNKFSYSGNVLEGDRIAFFATPKNSRREAMAGMLQFRDIPGQSDIDGTLRYSQVSGGSGVPYAAGYDQSIAFIGSKYVSAGFVQIPAQGFDSIANNAIASFTGGTNNGTSYVFTWESRGKMNAPKLPIYTSKGKMKNKTGFYKIKYVSKDASNDFVSTKSSVRGVVIQKQDLASGQAITKKVSGRYSVLPNEGGDVAPSTVITPKKKKLSVAETTYYVQVTVDTAWQVVIPNDIDWVTTDVVTGAGNGQVAITVAANDLGRPREAKIRIASLEHKIEQDYLGDDNGGGGGGSTNIAVLTPATKLVQSWLGETYTVQVEANGDWDVEVPPAYFGWLSVSPSEGTGDGFVVVNVGTNPYFYSLQGSIIIGGAVHTITQWP